MAIVSMAIVSIAEDRHAQPRVRVTEQPLVEALAPHLVKVRARGRVRSHWSRRWHRTWLGLGVGLGVG